MKSTIQPGWLVSLMCQLVRRELAVKNHSLGYPKKAPGFSEKITTRWNHGAPVDFNGVDFADLEAALDLLRDLHPERFAAMMMHYKPWSVRGLREEGWPFGNSTYYARLHRGHAWVAAAMDQQKVAA